MGCSESASLDVNRPTLKAGLPQGLVGTPDSKPVRCRLYAPPGPHKLPLRPGGSARGCERGGSQGPNQLYSKKRLRSKVCRFGDGADRAAPLED